MKLDDQLFRREISRHGSPPCNVRCTRERARARFEAALALARNHAERHFLARRVRACD
jgi:hypothetical protein